ncbi:hypothetical protein NPX13_g2970 [Xylaria arbuscula]|uniref:Uncharacterized protein n=1 Tax=Xylaria arbuscula TaxID=114810 RepID=A0A9W8TN94_9PEZI|nr:hypothetical protein NPX13_g2970 [Xylaria arbuscula]
MNSIALARDSLWQTQDREQRVLVHHFNLPKLISSSDSPDFEFCDDGGRPKVVTYIAESKYRTGDAVYLLVGTTQEGPYMIATVPSVGRYTLCFANGHPARNGAEIPEDSLRPA